MQGDCVQVQQVVLNLVVLNAVEAMGWVEAGAREFVISTERTKMGGVWYAIALAALRERFQSLSPRDPASARL
jgi:nitrogen-specific signal transduction histidine kinase